MVIDNGAWRRCHGRVCYGVNCVVVFEVKLFLRVWSIVGVSIGFRDHQQFTLSCGREFRLDDTAQLTM